MSNGWCGWSVWNATKRGLMNEELFNLELRKFLKKFGITAQREIERAVREGMESGKLKGSERLSVVATLDIGELVSGFEVDGVIALE